MTLKPYADELKIQMGRRLKDTRKKRLDISQDEMSKRLRISLRSYNDLEKGRYFCSGLALMCYLIYCEPDVDSFIETMKAEIERIEKAMEDAVP